MPISRWITFGFRQHNSKHLAEVEDPDWLVPTLVNSWVNFDSTLTARYRKNALGQVQLGGAVRSGTASSTIFTLPLGFRPSIISGFAAPMANSGGTGFVGQIDVNANGTVSYVNTGATPQYVYLSPCTFRADGA